MISACQQTAPDEFNYGLTERKVIYLPVQGSYPATPVVDWAHYDGSPIQINGKEKVFADQIQQIGVKVGAIVLATGFDPYQPRTGEYGYGEIPEVVTLPELIRHLALHAGEKELKWKGRCRPRCGFDPVRRQPSGGWGFRTSGRWTGE